MQTWRRAYIVGFTLLTLKHSSLMPSTENLVAIGQILTYLDFVDFVARPAGAVIMLKDGDHRESILCSCVFLL